MCGRVNVSDHEGLQALLAMLGVPLFAPAAPSATTRVHDSGSSAQNCVWVPRWNISPSSLLTAVVAEAKTPDARLSTARFRWGITAPWAEPGKSVRPLINARSETLFSKPTFKHLANEHRAVVPVNGFYEWQRMGERRIPYYAQVKELPAMLLAVVFEPVSAEDRRKQTLTKTASPQMGFAFDEPVTAAADELENARSISVGGAPPGTDLCAPATQSALPFCADFAVVTTQATGAMAQVHHRTPVMLSIEQAKRWLYSEDVSEVQAMMAPEAIMDVSLHRVSATVNSTRNDGPECSLPAAPNGSDADQ